MTAAQPGNGDRLRVAYDISWLMYATNVRRDTTGLGRVVEELLHALQARRDVVPLVVGTGLRRHPFLRRQIAAMAQQWVDAEPRGARLNSLWSYRSRLGLEPVHTASQRFATNGSGIGGWRVGRTLIDAATAALQSVDVVESLDTTRFDVFHSPYFEFPPQHATRRAPRVLTVHDLVPVLMPGQVSRGLHFIFRKTLQAIDCSRDWVATVSEHTKRDLCNCVRIKPERVFVTPPAAANHFRPETDPSRIAMMRKRYGLAPGPYLLAVANSQPRKNLVHLIRCFGRLVQQERSLEVNLVLVGPRKYMGPEAAALAALGAQAAKRVAFTGYVAEEDLAAVYSGAEAFVFPSLYEGFGLPALEAMSCGTPVITSNVSSLPEVVGDAAIVINPTDGDALCAAMLRVLNDGMLRRKLAAKGLERAATFSWARCAEETVRLYRTALAER